VAQSCGLPNALRNLLLHGQRHLDRRGGDRLEQQGTDRLVDGHALDPQAWLALSKPHQSLVATVVGLHLSAQEFIVHSHARAAAPAQHSPLEQGIPLARSPTAQAV
jgi:hypothetical protein